MTCDVSPVAMAIMEYVLYVNQAKTNIWYFFSFFAPFPKGGLQKIKGPFSRPFPQTPRKPPPPLSGHLGFQLHCNGLIFQKFHFGPPIIRSKCSEMKSDTYRFNIFINFVFWYFNQFDIFINMILFQSMIKFHFGTSKMIWQITK